MNSLTQIERVLSICAEQIAVCAGDLSELKLLEKEKGVYKLGKATAEINEVRSAIYQISPELKPELWDGQPTDENYAAWFAEAEKLAADYIGEGLPYKAVSIIESFLFIDPSQNFERLAHQELERLRALKYV